LLIWEQKTPSDAMPPGLAALPGVQAGGSEAFATPRFPGAQPVLIGYAILPPG